MAYSLLLSDEFSEEEFLEARAKFNAHSAIFGVQFSDKEVKEKLKERKDLKFMLERIIFIQQMTKSKIISMKLLIVLKMSIMR